MTVQFLEEQSPPTPSGEEILVFTDKAVEMLRQTAERDGGEGLGLRVGVIGGGCSGMQYHLAFEPGPKPQDSVLDIGGVPVFIDAESQSHLAGMTIDYVSALNGAGFKFLNPNAARTCGCGTSFST